MADTKPDPAVVGTLTAYLQLTADHAGVPRDKAEAFAAYLLHTDARVRAALIEVVGFVVSTAKEHETTAAYKAAQDQKLADYVAKQTPLPVYREA